MSLISVCAAFSSLAADIVASLEEPAKGGNYAGVGNLRGWAVSPDGIDKVRLYIDGTYVQELPYGGLRNDVANQYPDYPDAGQAGFSIAYNYSGLGVGPHSAKVIATDYAGSTLIKKNTFKVIKFGPSFIADPAAGLRTPRPAMRSRIGA